MFGSRFGICELMNEATERERAKRKNNVTETGNKLRFVYACIYRKECVHSISILFIYFETI